MGSEEILNISKQFLAGASAPTRQLTDKLSLLVDLLSGCNLTLLLGVAICHTRWMPVMQVNMT